MSKKKKIRSNLGNVYGSKRWAKRFARGRPVRKVPGGWMICRKRKRKAKQRKASRRKASRRKIKHKRKRRRRNNESGLIIEF